MLFDYFVIKDDSLVRAALFVVHEIHDFNISRSSIIARPRR